MEKVVVLAADFGLRRPAIAILTNVENGKALIERMFVIDTKKNTKMCRSQILSNINTIFREQIIPTFVDIVKQQNAKGIVTSVAVRESGFTRFHTETQALYAVMGITDMALYETLQLEWYNIAPLSIKKLVTGSGKATKAEVASSLNQYLVLPIENYKFEGDDETDAVGVGLAWMIQRGYVRRERTETDALGN